MKYEMQLTTMRNQDANAGDQNELPTYLGSWGPEDQVMCDVR
jgi:hypothetical protein